MKRKDFYERIKNDTTEISLKIIWQNHKTLFSALKCRFCRWRLDYLIWERRR